MTADESWFQHFDPETKQHGIELYLQRKGCQNHNPQHKIRVIMGKFFCDAEGCILIYFLPKTETGNAVSYAQMLQKL
jgi:hypothetical protein